MYDAFIIVLISIGAALVSEAISWVLIYRTEEFQKLQKSIANLTAKVDKKKSDKKSESSVSDGRVLTKKLGALDEQLKAKNRELSVTKMKSTMFIGVVMIGVFGLLSNLFDGVVVAKLPFEPFALLRNMSHRGLSGSDPTQCSFMLIYMLCQLSVRANVQKLLGLAPATTGPSLFQLPESQ